MTPEERIKSDTNLRRRVRDHFATLDVPGTPSVRNARFMLAMGIPDWCGTRQVHDIRVTRGDPVHGAKRSDDHIGRFEIEIPFEEIEWDDVNGTIEEAMPDGREWTDVCIECGCHMAMYVYSATHFIAGHEKVFCPECETLYASEDWG